MKIDKNTTLKIAKLTRLKLENDEIAELSSQLNSILDWVEQLNEVDVEGVEPMTGVSGMTLREREDNILDGGYAEKIVINSKEKKNNSFSVPKVIE